MKRKVKPVIILILILSLFAGCNSPDAVSEIGANSDDFNNDSNGYYDSTDNPNVVAYRSDPPQGFSVTNIKDTLTASLSGEATVLYPQGQNNQFTAIPNLNMYENLVFYNTFTNEYEGRLAEKWEHIDDKTLRVYIRKGVTCHAGYEFTAHDVLWTLNQGANSPLSSHIFEPFDVDNCEVIDNYTIDIRTYNPFGAILTYLANPNHMPMCNQKAYEEQNPDDYARNPTGGTGPYKFVDWIAGDRIILERYEDYYGEKPYFKNLIIRIISDDISRALSLEAGEVDMIYNVDGSAAQSLINSDTTDLITCPAYQNIFCCFNLNVKPLNDINVRRAMRYALDIDSMVKIAFSGMAIPAEGFFVPSLDAYTPIPPDEVYNYDLEHAKQLMLDAGYPDGFTIQLWTVDTNAWMQLTEMMQNAWEKIGIKSKVTVMDVNTFWDRVENSEHEVFVARASSADNEADLWRLFLHSEADSYSNYPQYKNPRFDELMDNARLSNDPDFRKECYAEVQRIVNRDLPWIPLACPMMMYGVRSTLMGVSPHSYGFSDLRYIRPKP